MTNTKSSRETGERPGGVTIGDVHGSIVNSIISGGDIIQKFFVGDQVERDRKNKLYLLEKVTTFWVKGVLEGSVHSELLIELQKQDRAAAVERPWDAVLAGGNHDGESVPSAKSILQVFREQGQALLILGEPGSGKTITLLELARDVAALVAEDPSVPIPVVLNLSSWTAQGRPLAEWLVQDLKDKYQVPVKQGRSWLENNDLLLLLDGLDEVEESRRNACAEAINRFREENGLTPMAVCCRIQEYDVLRSRLKLQGAILLRSLTAMQIEQYFERAGPSLSNVHALVQSDVSLGKLAQSPLMLSVMSLAYQEPVAPLQPDTGSGEQSPTDKLFSAYITRMFRHRKTRYSYTPDTMRNWLIWLARKMLQHNQSIFLLESLQPSWLSSARQRWSYVLATRLAIALIVWSGFFLVAAAFSYERYPVLTDVELSALVPFVGIGLTVGVLDGWRFQRQARSGSIAPPRERGMLRSALDVLVTSFLALFGLASGTAALALSYFGEFALLAAVIFLISFGRPLVIVAYIVGAVTLTFGLILGLRTNRGMLGHDIQLVENLNISWRRFILAASAFAAIVGGGALIYTSATRNPAAKIWDTAGNRLADLEDPEGINTAAFNRDGTRVAVLDRRDELRLYDTRSGSEIAASPTSYSPRMRFTPDGRRLVVDDDQVWDIIQGRRLIHAGGLASSPNGTRLVGRRYSNMSEARSGNTQLWDVMTGEILAEIPMANDYLKVRARFSDDGSRLVVNGDDQKIQLWNSRDGTPMGDLGAAPTFFTPILSPSGDRLVTMDNKGRPRLWNTADGKMIAAPEGTVSFFSAAAFSPDGSRLAFCHTDGIVRIWDSQVGVLVSTLQPPPMDCSRILSFDATSTRIFDYDSTTGSVLLSDTTSGKIVFYSGDTRYKFARLGPDGTRLATTDRAGTVDLWDAQTGHQIATLEKEQGVEWAGFHSPLSDAYPSFTPDGRRVLTLQRNGAIRLWDARTGTLVTTLLDTARRSVGEDQSGIAGPAAAVESLVSPDGRIFQIGRENGTLSLYDTTNGKLVATLKPGGRRQGIFSADGQRIATLAEPFQVAPDYRIRSALAVPFALLAALLLSLRRQIRETKTFPGEGIRLSARNSVLVGVLGGLVAIMPICTTLFFLQKLHASDWLIWLSAFFFLLILISLFSGMIDVVQYIIIRVVLFLGRITPWRYARFLDHASDLILLRRVGGGYIFIHRLLLEHFARQGPYRGRHAG